MHCSTWHNIFLSELLYNQNCSNSMRGTSFGVDLEALGKLHSHFCSVLLIWAARLHLHPLWRQQHVVLLNLSWWRSLGACIIIRLGRAEELCCSPCSFIWTQGPCLDAHDNQPCPTHLILLQRLDSVQLLHHRSSPAPREHVFGDGCGGGGCQPSELTLWMKAEGVSKQGLVGRVPCLSWKKPPMRTMGGVGGRNRGASLYRTWQWKTYSGVGLLYFMFHTNTTPSGSWGASSLLLYEATRSSGYWWQKKKYQPKWMLGGGGVQTYPPGFDSMWTSLACPLPCCWMP